MVWATYVAHRETFRRAVNRLRRAGWTIDADFEDDLVHEFLLDRVPHVLKVHDPSRGPLEALLFVSFVHFAVTQLRTLRRQARLLDALAERWTSADEASLEQPHDLSQVRSLLDELPSTHKAALESFLTHGSLRAAAASIGLSRWQTRRRVLAALRSITRAIRHDIDDETVLQLLTARH
jgi:DNA-directed RNA polymerase specialized sigma24 family protein